MAAGNHRVLILKEIWIYLLKSTTEAWQWARHRMTCLYSYLFKNMLRPLCHNLVSSYYDHKTTKKMTIQNDSSIITVVKLIHNYYFYQKRQTFFISMAWIMTYGSRLIWLSNPLPLINMRCFLWPQYILLKTPCLLRWSISSQTSGGCGDLGHCVRICVQKRLYPAATGPGVWVGHLACWTLTGHWQGR